MSGPKSGLLLSQTKLSTTFTNTVSSARFLFLRLEDLARLSLLQRRKSSRSMYLKSTTIVSALLEETRLWIWSNESISRLTKTTAQYFASQPKISKTLQQPKKTWKSQYRVSLRQSTEIIKKTCCNRLAPLAPRYRSKFLKRKKQETMKANKTSANSSLLHQEPRLVRMRVKLTVPTQKCANPWQEERALYSIVTSSQPSLKISKSKKWLARAHSVKST